MTRLKGREYVKLVNIYGFLCIDVYYGRKSSNPNS